MKSKEQNVMECKECIKKLKKKLEDNGFNILCVNDDILIKTPRRSVLSRTNSLTTSSCKIREKCPHNAAGAIDTTNKTCTCSGNCNIEQSKCPVYNGSLNNGNSSNSNNSNSVCLFRIRPTDIYNGIFLHAITLYNEECDLKMTFGYDSVAINQIISVLNFLV